ncbi:MAG: hypothetical protein JWR37_5659, partial [Mycobacterium sp.]|nr:hypothetical protein [Mycobacterium sp.]
RPRSPAHVEDPTLDPWSKPNSPQEPGSPTPNRPGVAAIHASHKVRYFTAADLVETLYRGPADNTVGKIIESLRPPDPLALRRTAALALSGRVPRGVDGGVRAGTTKHPGTGPSYPRAENSPGPPPSASPDARSRD